MRCPWHNHNSVCRLGGGGVVRLRNRTTGTHACGVVAPCGATVIDTNHPAPCQKHPPVHPGADPAASSGWGTTHANIGVPPLCSEVSNDTATLLVWPRFSNHTIIASKRKFPGNGFCRSVWETARFISNCRLLMIHRKRSFLQIQKHRMW